MLSDQKCQTSKQRKNYLITNNIVKINSKQCFYRSRSLPMLESIDCWGVDVSFARANAAALLLQAHSFTTNTNHLTAITLIATTY